MHCGRLGLSKKFVQQVVSHLWLPLHYPILKATFQGLVCVCGGVSSEFLVPEDLHLTLMASVSWEQHEVRVVSGACWLQSAQSREARKTVKWTVS